MSTTYDSTVNTSEGGPERGGFRAQRRGRCARANWSGVNIAAMVVGFVFFWPAGLVILYWIISGREVRDLPAAIKSQISRVSGNWSGGWGRSNGLSDNVVFNDYQQTQFDRIREIKDEIKSRADRFDAFRADAKRRADQEEFDRFMSSAPGTHGH